MFKYTQYGLKSANSTNCGCNGTNGTNGNGTKGTNSNALPLSKTSGLSTSTNNSRISCRMKYSQTINAYGTVAASTSYPLKTCSIGGPTFSY